NTRAKASIPRARRERGGRRAQRPRPPAPRPEERIGARQAGGRRVGRQDPNCPRTTRRASLAAPLVEANTIGVPAPADTEPRLHVAYELRCVRLGHVRAV